MHQKYCLFIILLAGLLFLAACGPQQPAPTQAPTADTQATIDAAVKATSDAQKAMQATIDVAVKATATQTAAGQQSEIEKSVQATISAQPTPEYGNISEEEMAKLIEDSVNKAMTDYATASQTVSQSTSDGTVTAEEAAASYEDAYAAYYAAIYAEEIIQAYYDYYGAYADEALDAIAALEDDLEVIADSMNEIAEIMEQGAETATKAIDQINQAAGKAQAKASEIQSQTQELQDKVKTQVAKREEKILQMPATDVANNEVGAINQVNDFLDAFKTSLSDGKFSPEELQKIGQLSSNAVASLNKTGNPKLQQLTSPIQGLTKNAARGEWGQASRGVKDFERSAPARRK